jgi:hypothetical protein
VLKSTTPEFNLSVAKDLQDSITKTSVTKKSKTIDVSSLVSKSFSPTVNQLLTNLQTLSLHPYSFGCENNQQIRIKHDGEEKCVDWESKEAQSVMLRNLKKKHLDFGKIVAPANIDKNAWFNCFFMNFFISDKGRKFFRIFRYQMIMGKYPTGETGPKLNALRWPLFLLNYYIDASTMGKDDPQAFAEQMNTNALIKEIGMILQPYHGDKATMPGSEGNPINYYSILLNFLGSVPIMMIKGLPKRLRNTKSINKFLGKKITGTGRAPHIVVILVKEGNETPLNKSYEITVDTTVYKYSLDSATVLSLDRKHWVSLISGNKRDYAFDGASFSRLTPYEWKNKINTVDEFSFEGSDKKYSFAKSDTYLIYYRS